MGLCCNKEILCRDIVSLVEKIFYRDRGFLGSDRVGKARSSLLRHIILMSRQKLAKVRRNYVAIEQFDIVG